MNRTMIVRGVKWVESPPIQRILITLILLNALILGLESYPGLAMRWGEVLSSIDRIILAVFVVELGYVLLHTGWRFSGIHGACSTSW